MLKLYKWALRGRSNMISRLEGEGKSDITPFSLLECIRNIFEIMCRPFVLDEYFFL